MKAPIGFLFFAKAFILLSEAGVFSASVVIFTVSSWVGNQLCRTQTLEHTHKFIYIYVRTYSPEHTEEVGDYQICSYGISEQHQQSIDRAAPPAVCVMVTGRTHTLWNTVTTQTFTERRGERRGGEERPGWEEKRGEERIRKEREGEERIGEVFFLVLKGEERERPGGEESDVIQYDSGLWSQSGFMERLKDWGTRERKRGQTDTESTKSRSLLERLQTVTHERYSSE